MNIIFLNNIIFMTKENNFFLNALLKNVDAEK